MFATDGGRFELPLNRTTLGRIAKLAATRDGRTLVTLVDTHRGSPWPAHRRLNGRQRAARALSLRHPEGTLCD